MLNNNFCFNCQVKCKVDPDNFPISPNKCKQQTVIKIRINKPYGEYTVLCPHGNIDNYYYTNELADAIATAKRIYGNNIVVKKVYAKQN